MATGTHNQFIQVRITNQFIILCFLGDLCDFFEMDVHCALGAGYLVP